MDYILVTAENLRQTRNMPCPCTSFALFRDETFVTKEIQSEAKFLKLAGGD